METNTDYTNRLIMEFLGYKSVKHPILNWKIKKDIEWIKDCPLPEGEVFMRL